MKRLLPLLILAISIILFIGCGGKDKKISEAKDVAEIYLKTLYKVEDYTKIVDGEESIKLGFRIMENLKPYITEKMYESIHGSRLTFIPPQLAVKYKGNIEVSSIVYNKESIYNDTGVVTLDCIVTIKLKASDGTEIRSYNNRTIIQLKEEGGKYKVHSDDRPILDFKSE